MHADRSMVRQLQPLRGPRPAMIFRLLGCRGRVIELRSRLPFMAHRAIFAAMRNFVAIDPEPTFSTFRGWRLLEYAIRTSNWSLTKKRASSLQVRDPHDCDHVPVIVRLLFCFLVAGPDKVLLGR